MSWGRPEPKFRVVIQEDPKRWAPPGLGSEVSSSTKEPARTGDARKCAGQRVAGMVGIDPQREGGGGLGAS